MWFNRPYHNRILQKSGKVLALANYQRAPICIHSKKEGKTYAGFNLPKSCVMIRFDF